MFLHLTFYTHSIALHVAVPCFKGTVMEKTTKFVAQYGKQHFGKVIATIKVTQDNMAFKIKLSKITKHLF